MVRMNDRVPALRVAALASLACLAFLGALVALAPPASADDDEEPGAPPAAGEPNPPEGGRRSPAPPDSIEKAYLRLESLRKMPLTGPGAMVRRRERLHGLAEAALALHAKTPATGEDLFRLAELCTDGDRPAEAVGFAAAYLASGGGKDPLPSEGPARALEIRGLAATGKLAEADAALKAYAERMPGADGLAPVGKSVGDAWLEAGKPAEALARYREAHARLVRPVKAGTAATVQALAEALAFHGETAEARKVVEKAMEESAGDRGLEPRFRSVLRRLEMTGEKFPVPPLDRWLGAAPPTEPDLKGKVVVWHLFGWWAATRPAPLEGWTARLPEWGPRGLVLLPVTRTAGWDPAAKRFRGDRRPAEEIPDIEKAVRGLGWAGPVGVSFEGALFNALLVRGLPMEVVVGRDGLVVFCQGGSDPGHRLALLAAERALAAPAPPPPGGR